MKRTFFIVQDTHEKRHAIRIQIPFIIGKNQCDILIGQRWVPVLHLITKEGFRKVRGDEEFIAYLGKNLANFSNEVVRKKIAYGTASTEEIGPIMKVKIPSDDYKASFMSAA